MDDAYNQSKLELYDIINLLIHIRLGYNYNYTFNVYANGTTYNK